jgi:hypothetical protein
MRWAIVAASLLVMLAAWHRSTPSRGASSRHVEDQSHISLFLDAAPDATLEAVNRESLEVVDAVTALPRGEVHVVADRAWGGFGGMVAKNWKERARSTEQMYGELFGAVSQVPGCASSRASTRRCRRPASTTSSSCCRATRRSSSCSRPPMPVVGAAGRAASSCTSTPT